MHGVPVRRIQIVCVVVAAWIVASCGPPPGPAPAVVAIDPPLDLAVGGFLACQLGSEGRLSCWGSGVQGLGAAAAERGLSAVTASDRQVCVVASDKRVKCWGG